MQNKCLITSIFYLVDMVTRNELKRLRLKEELLHILLEEGTHPLATKASAISGIKQINKRQTDYFEGKL